jgi:hypothetical protein
MEWWLAVLGFIMSLFATADLAYKYGSAILKKYPKRPLQDLFKKIRRIRSGPGSKAYYLHAGPGRFQVTGSSVAFFEHLI